MKHQNAELLKAEMLASREDIVDSCKLQEKTVKIKGKDTLMKKGPCSRIDGNKCAAYISPSAKWRIGNCHLATHLIYSEDIQKVTNPLKASRRANR